MIRPRELPLLRHSLRSASIVEPESDPGEPALPAICVLETDGRLTDWLIGERIARPALDWPSLQAPLYLAEIEGVTIALIPRTIGGPYAVLVAEQLWAAGARIIVGLAPASAVGAELPASFYLTPTRAVRDEGSSFHYLEPSEFVSAPIGVTGPLREELEKLEVPVYTGAIWTTDAPFRQTRQAVDHYSTRNILALDMQTASLYAFAAARGACVGMVAHVGIEPGLDVLRAIVGAGLRVIEPEGGMADAQA